MSQSVLARLCEPNTRLVAKRTPRNCSSSSTVRTSMWTNSSRTCRQCRQILSKFCTRWGTHCALRLDHLQWWWTSQAQPIRRCSRQSTWARTRGRIGRRIRGPILEGSGKWEEFDEVNKEWIILCNERIKHNPQIPTPTTLISLGKSKVANFQLCHFSHLPTKSQVD